MASNKGGRQLTKDQAETFDKAQEKLITFHADVEKLSNKKPDGPLNPFKLGFINQVLSTMNQLLGGAYRPFPDFTTFDIEASIPSASDVVMMLSQYRKAMDKFRREHQTTTTQPDDRFEGLGIEHTVIVWNLSDAESGEASDASENGDEE